MFNVTILVPWKVRVRIDLGSLYSQMGIPRWEMVVGLTLPLKNKITAGGSYLFLCCVL